MEKIIIKWTEERSKEATSVVKSIVARENRLLVSDIFNPNSHGRSVSVRAEDPRRTTQLSADACAEQPRNSSEKVKYAMKHEMKLIVWIGIFATAALGVSAQETSCVIYDGSLCSSVFGQANITIPSHITTISAFIACRDLRLGGEIELFSAVQDQDCLNYYLFLVCLIIHSPCPGSAWCGANSRDELRSAVTSACSCNRDDSCVVNVNGVNSTVEDVLMTAINRFLPNYYVGSSSTGPVGDSNATCQDVTVSGSIGNMKASLMSIALVAILFSAGLWLL